MLSHFQGCAVVAVPRNGEKWLLRATPAGIKAVRPRELCCDASLRVYVRRVRFEGDKDKDERRKESQEALRRLLGAARRNKLDWKKAAEFRKKRKEVKDGEEDGSAAKEGGGDVQEARNAALLSTILLRVRQCQSAFAFAFLVAFWRRQLIALTHSIDLVDEPSLARMAEYIRLFCVLDADGSGTISHDELQAFVKHIAPYSDPKGVMRAFDEDDDGTCGEEEFVVGLHRYHANGGNLVEPTHVDQQVRVPDWFLAMLCFGLVWSGLVWSPLV